MSPPDLNCVPSKSVLPEDLLEIFPPDLMLDTTASLEFDVSLLRSCSKLALIPAPPPDCMLLPLPVGLLAPVAE